jgi:hypothetical protein
MLNGTYPEHCSDGELTTLVEKSEVKLIGEGSFHFAFLVKLEGYSPLVYRVNKDNYNGNIGNKIVGQFKNTIKRTVTVSRDLSKNPGRTVRLWKKINPGCFIRQYDRGTLVPYFDNTWKIPTDQEMTYILQNIYNRTGRIFLDVFCDNVRLDPSDSSKYVVIDPEMMTLMKKKVRNETADVAVVEGQESLDPGYESDATYDNWISEWACFFWSYADYKSTMSSLLGLLEKENQLDMINPLKILKKTDASWSEQDYLKILNSFAYYHHLYNNPTTLKLMTSQYINLCCSETNVKSLYSVCIAALIKTHQLKVGQLLRLIDAIVDKLKCNVSEDKQRYYRSLLKKISDYRLVQKDRETVRKKLAACAQYLDAGGLNSVSRECHLFSLQELACLMMHADNIGEEGFNNLLNYTDKVRLSSLYYLTLYANFNENVKRCAQQYYHIFEEKMGAKVDQSLGAYVFSRIMKRKAINVDTVDLKLLTNDNQQYWRGQAKCYLGFALCTNYIAIIKQLLINNASGSSQLQFNIFSGQLNLAALQIDRLKQQQENHALKEFMSLYAYKGSLKFDSFDDLLCGLICTKPTAAAKGWFWQYPSGNTRWQVSAEVLGVSHDQSVQSPKMIGEVFKKLILNAFTQIPDGSHITRRANWRYSSLYNGFENFDALCQYLFNKRHTAHRRGWWWEAKTGYASWQAFEEAIEINRTDTVNCNTVTEFRTRVLEHYAEKYKTIEMSRANAV